MNYFSIGSGSSGNCAYISGENTRLLLDAGISGKKTWEGLLKHKINPEEINGILITHEHRDHISCLGVLCRKYGYPVYLTQGTYEGILNSFNIGDTKDIDFNIINPGKSFFIDNIEITPVSVSHDAKEPVSYIFKEKDKRFAIITDLGKVSDELTESFKNLNAIVVEANHDVRMLETGIYPYHLKRRIAGDYGHLSNEDCGRFLSDILNDNFNWIVLAHLSAENNYEKLAVESVGLEITLAPNKYRMKDFPIYVAPRKEPGEMFII